MRPIEKPRSGPVQTLRSLAFDAVFYGGGLITSIFYLWTLLLPRKAMLRVLKAGYFDMVTVCERHILGLDFRVLGQENVPVGQPYIVAAKHQSVWETLKLYAIFGADPTIALKRELTRIPLWGWYAARADLIPINRAEGRTAMDSLLEGSRDAARQNRPIVIFPQGTRVLPGVHRRYKTGVARMYEELGLPVVPVALNSGMFWPRGTWIKKGGTITVAFLKPIPPGLPKQEFLEALERILEAESDRLVQAVGGPETRRSPPTANTVDADIHA